MKLKHITYLVLLNKRLVFFFINDDLPVAFRESKGAPESLVKQDQLVLRVSL